MKIQSIILLAVLAVLADAEPQLKRDRKQRRRRAVRDSNLADITRDIPESTSERIKQRYLKEIPTSSQRNLPKGIPTSSQRNVATKTPKSQKKDSVRDNRDFVDMNRDFVDMNMSMSMSMSGDIRAFVDMSMSMSMQIPRSYVDDMSMPVSMSMSM